MAAVLQKLRSVYLTNRFFLVWGLLILLFSLSFLLPSLFPLIQLLLIAVLAMLIVETAALFNRSLALGCTRVLPRLLNLGDQNTIALDLENRTYRRLFLTIIDELPPELQVRDLRLEVALEPGEAQRATYRIRPTRRGAYTFYNTNVFVDGPLRLLQRRLRFNTNEQQAPVFPSVLQMKQMELKAFHRLTTQKGIKRIRRIGHSYEFEQIKNYVRGDDYRSINWKASSRKHALMVNQYEDERSQQVYLLIDKSRTMLQPFDGLTLLDHAVNAALVIANIALKKYDKAGLITFADKIGTIIKADTQGGQLNKILHALYKEQERPVEADFELLYYATRKLIPGRSLLLLLTQLESMHALERVLPQLRRINRFHLLVVVFFENTGIRAFSQERPNTLEGIYQQTVARKFQEEKKQMVQKLRQYGIQCILTVPEELSVQSVNKYLELKARGLI